MTFAAVASRALAAIIMKTFISPLIGLVLLPLVIYSQVSTVNVDISIVKIDTTICKKLQLIFFTTEVEGIDTGLIIMEDRIPQIVNKLEIFQKYNVDLSVIQNFQSDPRFSCLTRLEHASALFIDGIFIWSKEKNIFPYKIERLLKKK